MSRWNGETTGMAVASRLSWMETGCGGASAPAGSANGLVSSAAAAAASAAIARVSSSSTRPAEGCGLDSPFT